MTFQTVTKAKANEGNLWERQDTCKEKCADNTRRTGRRRRRKGKKEQRKTYQENEKKLQPRSWRADSCQFQAVSKQTLQLCTHKCAQSSSSVHACTSALHRVFPGPGQLVQKHARKDRAEGCSSGTLKHAAPSRTSSNYAHHRPGSEARSPARCRRPSARRR